MEDQNYWYRNLRKYKDLKYYDKYYGNNFENFENMKDFYFAVKNKKIFEKILKVPIEIIRKPNFEKKENLKERICLEEVAFSNFKENLNLLKPTNEENINFLKVYRCEKYLNKLKYYKIMGHNKLNEEIINCDKLIEEKHESQRFLKKVPITIDQGINSLNF